MTTPPQIIAMSAYLSGTGTRPFADSVATAFAALCAGQPFRTGHAHLAEHGEHSDEREEKKNDLADHVTARNARTRRVLQ